MGQLTRKDVALNLFRQVFSKKQKKYLSSSNFGWYELGGSFSSTSTKNARGLNAYTSVQYVPQCIDRIVNDVIQPFEFYEKSTGKLVEYERLNDKLKMIFYQNTVSGSFRDIKSALIAQMLLLGNSYVLKKQATAYGLKNNTIDTLVALDSELVTAHIAIDNMSIMFYTYNGTQMDGTNMLHFKQNPIKNGLIGIGNIQKIFALAESDVELKKWENELLSGRGLPSLFVTMKVDSMPDEETQNRQKQAFSDKVNGALNAGKAHMLFSDGDIGVHTISAQNVKEMIPIEREEYKRDQILTIFGVPHSVLGLTNTSQKNTDQTQEYKYYRSRINPLIQYLDDMFNTVVREIDPRVEMRTKKWSIGEIDGIKKQIELGIITPARGAELMGETVNWDNPALNTYYLANNLMPIELAGQMQQSQTPQQGQKKNLGSELTIGVLESIKPHQRDFVLKGRATKNIVEAKYTPIISDFFSSQAEEISKKIEENWAKIMANYPKKLSKKEQLAYTNDAVDLVFNVSESNVALATIARGMFTSAIQRGLTDINSITGAKVNIDTSNPWVSSAIKQLGSRITTGYKDRDGKNINIGETTRKQVQDVLTNAINNNESLATVQERIRNLGNDWNAVRSRLIARTEISKAYDLASYISYREIGVKTVDVVGCTMFEPNSDCGRKNIPIDLISSLVFHPNHIGTIAPSSEVQSLV